MKILKREVERERWRESVCLCVCVGERERERQCVSVREREREREAKSSIVNPTGASTIDIFTTVINNNLIHLSLKVHFTLVSYLQSRPKHTQVQSLTPFGERES
jgi:hypothetical protein